MYDEGCQLNLYGKKTTVKAKEEKLEITEESNDMQLDLFGKKAEEDMTREGNIVLGFTSNTLLMLDVDDQTERFTVDFAKKYAKFYRLGSVLVLRTSESDKTDLFGNRLGNYAIIFGKPIIWKEVQWHINETKKLGIINRSFAKLRDFGTITIRVNSKNEKIPPPEVIRFFNNGDMTGIVAYIKHKNTCEGLGESWLLNMEQKKSEVIFNGR